MTNREFSKINSILKFVNQTIHLYLLFVGMVILYLSYYSGIGQYGMGFAFVLGSVFYYVLKKKFDLEVPNTINQTYENNRLFLIINIIFLLSFSLSLIILYNSVYVRPTLYFILVTISFFSIFLEIFQIRSSTSSYIVIIKIILVSLALRTGRFFNYPSIPGSDTHFHLNMARSIIQNGVVPDYSIAGKYSYSCLWHVFEAINGIILNVNLHNMLFYSIVFSSTIITSLFVYCIVKKIYNYQVALIAVLFTNIADMLFVQNVTNINPSSIVYCFFLTILFCIMQQTNRSIYSLIVVFMILCIVLSHQLSTFCVFLILLTLLMSGIFYNVICIVASNENPIIKGLELHLYSNTLIYFTTLMVFYWSQMGPSVGNSFFDNMLYRLSRTITSMINEYLAEASASTTSYEQLFSSFNFYSNILYNAGSNFLLMLAIIGILLIFGFKSRCLFNFSYICATFMLFGLIYAGTYIGLGYLFIPHRFLSFFQFFLVIFASFSTYTIYKTNSIKWTKFGLMIIVSLLIFFSITTPYINRGDAIYSTDIVNRDQYTYSELKSLEWSNNSLKDQLFVDPLIYSRPLSTVEFLNISTNQIVPYNSKFYGESMNILIREYVTSNPNLKTGGTFGKTSDFVFQDIFIENSSYNLIYSINSARIFKTIE